MLRRFLPVFLLVLLIAGCVRQHVDMTVHPDGKQIDIEMIAAADTEWAAREGIDLKERGVDQQVDASAFGPEARWEDWNEGKWVGKKLLAPNTPIQNVITGGLLSYQMEGDQITFSTSPRQLGWGAESSNFQDVVNSEADLRLRVRVPGTVTDTNGHVEGEWVVWTTKDAALDTFMLKATAGTAAPQTGEASTAPGDATAPTGAPKPTPIQSDPNAASSQAGMPWWFWVALIAIGAIVGLLAYRFTGKR